VDDPVWDHSTFFEDCDRLLAGKITRKLLAAVPAQPQAKCLLSIEHFSVDGTLIEAWAPMKSFRPMDEPDGDGDSGTGRNAERDFHDETRPNKTRRSTTDSEARFYRKSDGLQAGSASFHLCSRRILRIVLERRLNVGSGG